MILKRNSGIKVDYKTLVVIWFALLVSQAVFLLATYIAKPELYLVNMSGPPLGPQPLITISFAVSALVFFILSLVLSRQYIRRAVADQDAGCVQTGLVLGCALSEIPSILGLMLALFWDYPFFFVWIALGTLGILVHFPQKGNLKAATLKSDPLA